MTVTKSVTNQLFFGNFIKKSKKVENIFVVVENLALCRYHQHNILYLCADFEQIQKEYPDKISACVK